MTSAPILHTDRLILRAHRLSDFDACLALWSDPGTVRFIGGQVQGEQAVWFRLLRYAGQWALLGHGFWVFEDRATGAFLGEGGLIEARRGIAALEGAPEVGWALAQAAQGRGIATEAVEAIVRWADAHVDAPCTRCIIEPENEASIRVAEKCGFVRGDRLDDDGTALILFERARGS
ncbi:GNAT family N-acetyltransferase [Sphingobium algorifonticola]|uniref:N-acetyltransferase n=1 Tax=Sphingobium algorifonticola TaxID=2008318 RepID=A0A437JA10_9SPHN|nr:GNAT family N-acetyltransferase [Sphingobium algorifonticola]RVT42142.1 N-acetyltransferase [Sphingobium algorifonticola]